MRGRLLFFVALLAAPLAAQQKLDQRIAIAPDASIRITNMAGTTRVLGWDRDSIAVTGMAAPSTTFFMGGAGRVAKLGLEPQEGSKPAGGEHLDVRVPRGARVWVKSAGGTIDIQALTGEVDLQSVSGAIRVTGSLRLVTAESIEGDIDIVGLSPLVRVKTGSGRILLRQANGDVTASTVSGPIIATEMQPQGARLETVSGPVSYSGTLNRRGTLTIQTHSGDVELQLPTTLGAEFELESLGGSVAVELPAKSGKPLKGKSLFFANEGGGAQVVVRSFKGRIGVFGQ
jgi:putative adhesin